jgi:hypothetical protein
MNLSKMAVGLGPQLGVGIGLVWLSHFWSVNRNCRLNQLIHRLHLDKDLF